MSRYKEKETDWASKRGCLRKRVHYPAGIEKSSRKESKICPLLSNRYNDKKESSFFPSYDRLTPIGVKRKAAILSSGKQVLLELVNKDLKKLGLIITTMKKITKNNRISYRQTFRPLFHQWFYGFWKKPTPKTMWSRYLWTTIVLRERYNHYKVVFFTPLFRRELWFRSLSSLRTRQWKDESWLLNLD